MNHRSLVGCRSLTFCRSRWDVLSYSRSIIAGHGNHFQQSYTLAYGAITEPIFARLGVFASARNFGVGGLGTLQAGMAIGAYVFSWALLAFALVALLNLLSHTLLPSYTASTETTLMFSCGILE
jgi:hypothetical protein